MSDMFVAEADNSNRQVVVVAVPLFDQTQSFVGVLSASLNLEGLSARLQKIGVPDRGEYIMAVDSAGYRIIHPLSELFGTEVSADDPVLLGQMGSAGVTTGVTSDGEPAIVAYEPLTVAGVRWGVAIKSPISKIYELTDASTLSIFIVIIVSVIIAGFILHGGFYWRRLLKVSGGSP